MKILLLNNYSMRSALARIQRGEYPPQHLYGHAAARSRAERATTWFPVGSSLFDVVRGGSRFWRMARAAIMRTVGDPIQEVRVLRNSKHIDVVFAADQWSAGGLLALKRIGFSLPPIMVLVHHPPRTRVQQRRLAAADRLVVLGPAAADALESVTGVRPAALPWGPDVEADVYRLARRSGTAEYDFIAAGRTNRDYEALVELAVADHLTGVVFDGATRWDVTAGNVQRRRQTEDYREILLEMRRARCVVMPFARDDVMSGLTEATDAMALGIPILTTASAAFPYDLESTGAGVIAKANTVEHLRASFSRLRREQRSAGELLATHEMALYEAALDRELAAALRESK